MQDRQPANLTRRAARPKRAATLLDVGESTFWRYAKRPDFPKAIRLSRRCTIFDEDELIAWRNAQREVPQ